MAELKLKVINENIVFIQTHKFIFVMNWYIAKLVFRVVQHNEKIAQFDEQLRLIEAEDDQQAFEKAQAIGAGEEEIFMNERREPVKWIFVNVAELQEVQHLKDGVQLCSRTEESEDPELYSNAINKKARNIQMRTFLQVITI